MSRVALEHHDATGEFIEAILTTRRYEHHEVILHDLKCSVIVDYPNIAHFTHTSYESLENEQLFSLEYKFLRGYQGSGSHCVPIIFGKWCSLEQHALFYVKNTLKSSLYSNWSFSNSKPVSKACNSFQEIFDRAPDAAILGFFFNCFLVKMISMGLRLKWFTQKEIELFSKDGWARIEPGGTANEFIRVVGRNETKILSIDECVQNGEFQFDAIFAVMDEAEAGGL
jgi:hypothetical protein